MGKAARTRNQSARQKIAAQQAAARRTEARRRVVILVGSIAAVLAAVAAIVIISLVHAPAKTSAPVSSAALARQVTGVPAADFNAVGKGLASGLTTISSQPMLLSGRKPEVLYMGGEFCPYCAAERWAIAAALSRFGSLSGLQFIHSSPTDAYPDTPTLSFYRARYASAYLSFVPVEWYGEASDPATPFGHVYLQRPTPQEASLFARYANSSIPFLDIANRYVLPRTSYLPSALAGLSWSQVAADMHNPSSAVGQDIVGAANIIAAAICKVSGGQPSAVCRSAGVTAAAGSL